MNLYWGHKAKKKRFPVALQLAPLIDIFVLIIIFLVKGTVLGGISVTLPDNTIPAKSISAESMEAAPEVFVLQDKIVFKNLKKEFPLKEFVQEQFAPTREAVLKELIDFYKNLNSGPEAIGNTLNLVADARVDYAHIYFIVQFLKQANIENILFIAEGES